MRYAWGMMLAAGIACGGDSGSGIDAGGDDAMLRIDAGPSDGAVDASTLEEMCGARANACVVSAADSFEGQCTLDPTRRDCILAAASCTAMPACYMGPLPDGSSTTFCEAACELCGEACAEECATGDDCVASAETCEELLDCLGTV